MGRTEPRERALEPRRKRLKLARSERLAYGSKARSLPKARRRSTPNDMAGVWDAVVSFGLEEQEEDQMPVEVPRGNEPSEEMQNDIETAIEGPLGVPIQWLAASGIGIPEFWLRTAAPWIWRWRL